jgi:FKBP-type peptidyl-prolyl cis-trans isomerase FklB
MQNEIWLAQNAQKDSVITSATGLQYKCIFPGHSSSTRPDDSKYVTIQYSGKLINGYEFDSSESVTENVSNFIPGFSEGLKKMHQFAIYEFYIPYYLGYGMNGSGAEGTPSHIPPYSTLIFRVELKGINQ